LRRKRVLRTVTIDEQLDQLVKRLWAESINHGWRRPSYSLALNNLLYALFTLFLDRVVKQGPVYKTDKEAALKALELISGTRQITKEDYDIFERWLQAVGRNGYLEPRSIK